MSKCDIYRSLRDSAPLNDGAFFHWVATTALGLTCYFYFVDRVQRLRLPPGVNGWRL